MHILLNLSVLLFAKSSCCFLTSKTEQTFLTKHCISCILSIHSAQCKYLDSIFFYSFSGTCSPSHLKMAAKNNQLWSEI